ncbi:MAG: ParB N-terminal domain-containing protein [Pseudomonadota bacterium]
MSKKRRVFDIDMPDDVPETAPTEPQAGPGGGMPAKRGPMASAISENAKALTERAVVEAEIRAENDALAHEFVGLKRAGLVAEPIPLDAIVTEALVRDRLPGPDKELDELIASIRDVGLSNPIRVEARSDGKYELIQGMRRLSAYRRLREEEGEAWETIPAGILPHGEGIAGLYRRMVDENIVRKDLSFAEMASAAQAYAADPATGPNDVDGAVKELFKSAGYSKRSYIRAFARLMDLVGKHLVHPQHMPRNLGLALLKRVDDRPELQHRLAERLEGMDNRSVQEELDVLREIAGIGDGDLPQELGVQSGTQPVAKAGRRPRTTFELTHGGRRVKCTAGVGHLTLKLDDDLTAVERRRLEEGIARLLDALSTR